MRSMIALTLIVAAVALGACRREAEYVPMKLGAAAPAADQAAK